jgi:hypothetical protein
VCGANAFRQNGLSSESHGAIVGGKEKKYNVYKQNGLQSISNHGTLKKKKFWHL